MFTVYILKSEKSNRYYIGHTNNIEDRIKRHNRGQNKSTKICRPWKVIYTEHYNTKSEAYQREMEIKRYKSGIKFKKLLGLPF